MIKKPSSSGFSLLELLITLTIAFILVTLAVPAFGGLIKDNRMVLRVNSFIGMTNYARSEAVKRSSRVTLCPSSDGATCLTTGAWELGWIVFVDGDDSGDMSAGDTFLQVHEELSGQSVTVRASFNLRRYISYNGNGLIRQVNGTLQSGTIAFCDDRGVGTNARTVTVSAIGRLSATTGVTSCTP
jgi:type IV fimbrial biogenesis protein FimT